jgi:phenylalanyl-tRNA synthetase alpha chain
MALELQQQILDILDQSNEIGDTRTIVLPGESKPASTQDAQLLIQGALNSLLSREVNYPSIALSFSPSA